MNLYKINVKYKAMNLHSKFSLCSAGWSWRLELEWCERKILLGWLELVAGVM